MLSVMVRLKTYVRGEAQAVCAIRKNLTIIMVMDKTLPLANVKAHLSEIVDQVESAHDRVILTRNGRPAAVIISPNDLEVLEETLDLLSRPGVLDEIQQAREEIDDGRFLTAADLRARFPRLPTP